MIDAKEKGEVTKGAAKKAGESCLPSCRPPLKSSRLHHLYER